MGKKKHKLKRVGVHSKLGVLATWVKMFAENEKKHLTDPQLLERMKKEFPGYEKKSKIFSNVQAHRNFLHRGLLPGGKPKTKSVKYDK